MRWPRRLESTGHKKPLSDGDEWMGKLIMSSVSPRAALIDIQDLSIGFTGRNGQTLPVLRNIDVQVRAGESLGLVGESGSGKSTLALAAMG